MQKVCLLQLLLLLVLAQKNQQILSIGTNNEGQVCSIFCYNFFKLGDGVLNLAPKPEQVIPQWTMDGCKNIVQLATSIFHACARVQCDNAVTRLYCWGNKHIV